MRDCLSCPWSRWQRSRESESAYKGESGRGREGGLELTTTPSFLPFCSKRVHSCVQAFDNILDVVYPLSSAAATVAQIGVDPLGATSSRRVGESIEVWIELQLQEEFGYLANSEEEESSRVEGRRIELRDDWWESLPEQWRR